MKCPRCQREINEENQYCPYCGQRIIKRTTTINKELKRMRYNHISFVMNRILNIATIVAIVFAVIGVFGPVLSFDGDVESLEVGGLAWFTYLGWMKLRDGLISTGPFYLTFGLYILLFIGVLVIAPFGIYKAINSIRRNDECKTIPHIILLSLIHGVYTALVNNFYYEYERIDASYYETGSGWGSTIYSFAIPLFTIGLIILLVMKVILTADTSKKIVRHIFALVCSLAMLNGFTSIFNVLGIQDLSIYQSAAFGTLHYFDLVTGMPVVVGVLIVIAFALGLIYIGISIAFGITTLRNLVKYDRINRVLTLILGISQAVVIFALLVINIIFGNAVNLIDGWYSNIFYLSSDFILIILESMMVLGFSIAIFALGEDEVVNDNIIDVKVESKDA